MSRNYTQLSEGIQGEFDRMPPSDVTAEQCTIASMILDKEMLGDIVQIIDRDAFYQADNQIIFDILLKLYEAGQPIDGVIVRDELAKRQLLEEVGGLPYLAQILNTVPSSAHGAHYAGIVRQKAVLRQLIAASNNILRDAYAPHEQADTVLEKAEKEIFAIADRRVVRSITHFTDAMAEAFDKLEQRDRRGLETGYFDIDDMLSGLHEGEMILIAARPSIGKTALALNILEGVNVDRGIPVGIFSLEMSKGQIAERLLCSRGKVDSHKLRRGMLQAHEYSKLAGIVSELGKMTAVIDDSPSLSTMEFRAKARRMKSQHDVRLIIIDYLQLMDASKTEESRQQQVTEISRSIKAVARELKIPVIALSQLNRQSEGREGHRPRLSDLRESGSLEQDADVVMLLHREDYYRMTEPDFQPDNIAECIIAKQRSGPTGVVKLYFDPRSTRFENLSSMPEPAWANPPRS